MSIWNKMMLSRRLRVATLLVVVLISVASCGRNEDSGQTRQTGQGWITGEGARELQRLGISQERYEQAVSDFMTALAASETDEARFAFNTMNDVVLAFPEESAAWGNLAMMAMRQGNVDLALDRMERARSLSPDHPAILEQSAILASRLGRTSESVEFLERALRNEGGDGADGVDGADGADGADGSWPGIAFMLAEELEREGSEESLRRAQIVVDSLRATLPKNWVLPLELMRMAAAERDWQMVSEYLVFYEEKESELIREAGASVRSIREALTTESYAGLVLEISLLRTYLQTTARFEVDLRELQRPETNLGFLIGSFINLPTPEWSASPADLSLRFVPEELEVPGLSDDKNVPVQWVDGVALFDDGIPFPVVISNGFIHLGEAGTFPFPGTDSQKIRRESVCFFDFNNDFRMDLLMTGSEGTVLFEQTENKVFEERTQILPQGELAASGPFQLAWDLDIDMDGDLDLLLSAPGEETILLLNGGDNTFVIRENMFGEVGVEQLFWVDLDGDGPPDAIFRSESDQVFVSWNLRGGSLSKPVEVMAEIVALEVADLDADGTFELLMLQADNQLLAAEYLRESESWKIGTIVEDTDAGHEQDANEQGSIGQGSDGQRSDGQRSSGQNSDWVLHDLPKHAIHVADLDNNGSLDLLIRSGKTQSLWLGSRDHQSQNYHLDIRDGLVHSLFDVEGDDRLDLLLIDENNRLQQLDNQGDEEYYGTSIRARASGEQGDQRINSFGIGGEIEVRSGLLYQKRQIRSPLVHFGLGRYEQTDVLRIIWPNGSVQTGFSELGAGSTIFNEQILKGSCPWLFVSDGDEMHFVTDILWRSPLGLRINATETAGVLQTFDRVRIPPDLLKPIDGKYELRVTAELWETHFFDHVALLAADHPKGTHVWVDERFVFPPPDLDLRLSGPLHPVRSVTGRNDLSSGIWTDQTETIKELDRNYARPFVKSRYQGLVHPHEIIIELQDGLDSDLLILSGWLRPTDSSLNLALSQGSIAPPSGLKIEIDHGDGWKLLHENYGIPAGKLKTILVDLPILHPSKGDDAEQDTWRSNRVERVRLTTTSEIYWDRIAQAESMDSQLIRKTHIPWVETTLRYRGYSEWYRSHENAPKLGRYDSVSGTRQRWRDLKGFHTRFGDVEALLTETDERYVIMSAGDELVLRAPAATSPEQGWQRTFLFESDGWVKDGDYNTEASATVHPLPSRMKGENEFNAGASLFSDPVFEMHKNDWAVYHTRYITPYAFERAIRLENP